jgi:hypothetical protein
MLKNEGDEDKQPVWGGYQRGEWGESERTG